MILGAEKFDQETTVQLNAFLQPIAVVDMMEVYCK
jgi:hypothetical protein